MWDSINKTEELGGEILKSENNEREDENECDGMASCACHAQVWKEIF